MSGELLADFDFVETVVLDGIPMSPEVMAWTTSEVLANPVQVLAFGGNAGGLVDSFHECDRVGHEIVVVHLEDAIGMTSHRVVATPLPVDEDVQQVVPESGWKSTGGDLRGAGHQAGGRCHACDRVAMHSHHQGSGKPVEEIVKLAEMLWGLEDPPFATLRFGAIRMDGPHPPILPFIPLSTSSLIPFIEPVAIVIDRAQETEGFAVQGDFVQLGALFRTVGDEFVDSLEVGSQGLEESNQVSSSVESLPAGFLDFKCWIKRWLHHFTPLRKTSITGQGEDAMGQRGPRTWESRHHDGR